jgi:type IV pilus assembly protein PilY1
MSTLPISPSRPHWRQKLALVSGTLLLASAPALAVVDLPSTPLQIGSTVPPNILFQLDDSGSMQFEIMPEDNIPVWTYRCGQRNCSSSPYYVFPPPNPASSRNTDRSYSSTYYNSPFGLPAVIDFGPETTSTIPENYSVILRSSTVNTTYYDPAITYTPWRRADGSSFGNASITAAPWNPTNASAGTLNLTARQQVTVDWYRCSARTTCAVDNGTERRYYPITYYVYRGSGSTTDSTNYTRYQYRSGTLYRWDLWRPNSTESGIGSSSTVNWGGVSRTQAEEIQNFANWFTYYRSRILSARAGSSQAFADLGSGYRVGFITINEATRTAHTSNARTAAYMPVPINGGFASNNKSDFFDRMLGTPIPAQGTPLRTALDWAGRYFQRTDENGPWGPGIGADQVSCRRNYTILTTDGYWNDSPDLSHIGNSDNTDGPTHTSALANRADGGYTARRPFSDAHQNTLADIAMHYWKNDLRPDDTMPNNVPGGDGDAFWQHMVTFGLSIGVQGTLNPNEDLPALTSGTRTWPNPGTAERHKIDDLWHATVNSRGRFVAARNPAEFRRGLVDALRTIQDRTASASNVSANSTQLTDGARVYQASFGVRNNEWVGELAAYPISSSGLSETPLWQAEGLLTARAHTSRRIFSHNGSAGIEFTWGSLSTAQQAALGSAARVNFLRGDRTNEYNGAGGDFRRRTSLLGDIVNSSPSYNPDTRTIFVGANNGMMHAFNADTGVEVFGYVPGMLARRLSALSDRNYLHEYFVDGEIAISTRAQTAGRNYLIGALGRGGRGLYGLDVTNPSTFGASNVLWELSGDTEPDLGLVLGRPVIARTNSGDWVALVGNGYNSASERAVLFVIRLSDGQVLARMNTAAGSPTDSNGLATPAAFDADGNGTVDFVYAGDLHGNMWKFDLSAASSAGWMIANGGQPLFRAVGPDGERQPITGQPAVVANTLTSSSTYGSRYVLFGTGRYLTADDPATQNVQSIYGLIDDGSTITSRSELRQRRIVDAGIVADRAVRTFSAATSGDMENRRGWFMDLVTPSGQPEGERVVSGSAVYNFARPTLIVASIIPEQSECSSRGRGYLNAIDPFNGGAMPLTIFDVNRDRSFNDADGLNGRVVGSIALGSGMGTEAVAIGTTLVQGDSTGGRGKVDVNPGGPSRVGRISWREIVR